jgi:hypothetical protein
MLETALGRFVLERMRFDVPPSDDSAQAAAKDRVAKLKARMLHTFSQQAQGFLIGLSTEDPEEWCSICSSSEPPVLKLRSPIISILKARFSGHPMADLAVVPTSEMRLCLHYVHLGCVNNQRFSCPVDRDYRNILLPRWTEGFVQPPDLIIDAMRAFCEAAFETYYQAIASIKHQILVLEVRQRSSPNAVDDIRSTTLISHSLFAIAHGMTGYNSLPHGAFLRVVDFVIQSRTIDIRERVVELSREIEEPLRRFVFLRRSLILEFCLTGEPQNSRDWDISLSWEALVEHFGITHGTRPGNLPKFSFCKLPEDFLTFARPPYSVDFTKTRELCISLLTGEVIDMSSKAEAESGVVGLAKFQERFGHSYAPMLWVNRRNANSTFYWSMEWRKVYPAKPFYVDRFGDPDIGFRRGGLLKFSHDCMEREVDGFLSHAWVDVVV